MSDGTWAELADRRLAAFFADLDPGLDERELKQRLRALYPWGPRENWPYTVWTRRVRAWTAAYRAGLPRPVRPARPPRRVERRAYRNPEQTALMEDT